MALYVLGYWVGIHFYSMVPQFSTVRGLSKKFVEFVNKNKSTRVVALKFLLVLDPFKPDKI